jgi:hypothetical protein
MWKVHSSKRITQIMRKKLITRRMIQMTMMIRITTALIVLVLILQFNTVYGGILERA